MVAPLKVHWVRHGEVASHRGDVPLTEAGLARAREAGRRFAEGIDPAEEVHFLYAPTRRARETAEGLRAGAQSVREDVTFLSPIEDYALRNPDLYVAGTRVEMVSSPEALAEQLTGSGLGPDELSGHGYFEGFWAAPDPVGYWVGHPDPPGEDSEAVARRFFAFAASLTELPRSSPARYVCVTHSPVLRVFLRRYLTDRDPGEPDFLEFIDVAFTPDRPPSVSFRGISREVTSRA